MAAAAVEAAGATVAVVAEAAVAVVAGAAVAVLAEAAVAKAPAKLDSWMNVLVTGSN